MIATYKLKWSKNHKIYTHRKFVELRHIQHIHVRAGGMEAAGVAMAAPLLDANVHAFYGPVNVYRM